MFTSINILDKDSAMNSFPSVPVLTAAEATYALNARLPYTIQSNVYAMYSPVYRGIVTDPSLMVVPLDDRMVHRGHAVFDTCNAKRGKAYGLDFHLARFIRSAKQARIDYEKSYSVEEIRWIVLSTIAASGKRDNVLVRMWLPAGRGSFGISLQRLPRRCIPLRGARVRQKRRTTGKGLQGGNRGDAA